MTPQYAPADEHYRFLRLYSVDFSEVRNSLRILRRYRRDDVRYCILRDLIVAYARPFSGNRGDFHKCHRLQIRFVPTECRQLHDELLALRMKLFAHTDYTYYRPKVARWETQRGAVFPMSFRVPNYRSLLDRTEAILTLVDAVEANLRREITRLETGA